MTSREIVKRAIRYQCPPRLPVTMGSLGVTDVAWMPVKGLDRPGPKEPDVDEWGCGWAHTQVKNMGQVKKHPLEDLRKLETHWMPDYTDDRRYVDLEAALNDAQAKGKYTTCGIFMVLFERMHCLHGFENTLMGLYTNRQEMAALADRVADVHVTLIREVARRFPGRIDGWSVTDDWGTQQAAFIRFDLWMDFFFPRYKRIFDAMHDAGCDVWVHSCGKVNEIVEGYIRAGVDVVNLQQPRALGIEEMGRRYLGRITFQSLADIQATLPSGSRQRVDEDAEMLMRHWANRQGGFVFSDYGDDVGIGVKDSALKPYMYDAFSRWSERLYGEPLPPRKT